MKETRDAVQSSDWGDTSSKQIPHGNPRVRLDSLGNRIEDNERADQLSQKGAIETCGHVIDFARFRYK